MRMMIVLNSDEVRSMILYPLICMTRFGATWNTGKRKRRWAAEFTENERNASYKLFAQAHQWFCVNGVPDEVTMSTSTLELWQKLGSFCASL